MTEDQSGAQGDAAATPAPVADSLQLGSILAGRYRIVQRLGNGAMGAVYLGEHLRIGRKDAIKVLRDSLAHDREAMARFIRGARSVSRIRHENVCTIYDFSDTADGVQFLAMEYIPGSTLREVLEDKGTLPLERAVDIALQTANALQAAHDAGIVHRDLKPANIMIMPGRNATDVVKVVDFDIAKAQEDSDESEVTRMGFVVGTPEYMSPEQLTGERLDGRSDVYSLAIVFYRMVTGLVPFPSDNTREMLVSRLTTAPLPLSQMLPGKTFPPGLQPVLDWALQRNPDDRTPSAMAFGHALKEAVGPISYRPELTPPTRARTVGKAPATRVMTPAAGGTDTAQPEPTGWRKFKIPLASAALVAMVVAAWGGWSIINSGNGNDVVAPQTQPGQSATLPTPPSADPSAQEKAADALARSGGAPATDPARGGRTGGATDPGGGPPTAPPAGTSGIALSDVQAAINRQFLASFTAVDPDLLRAIRDTARAGFNQSSVDSLRAKAAYTVATMHYKLGQRDEGLSWAERAVNLCVERCQAYQVLLDLLRQRAPQ